jgi:putative peptidoglycan lipid II flippase
VLVVQLSYQVFAALSFVGSRAVSMAALPGLSEAVARSDARRFGTAWRQGVFYALVAGVPLLLLLAVFAGPTANLLANGALRNTMLITELSGCLMVAAFSQLANGVHDYARQALFARLDDRGPTMASIAGLVASAVVAAGAFLVPPGGTRLTVLVVALLVGEIASAVVALRRVRGAIRPEPMLDRRHLVTLSSAAGAMLPLLVLGWWAVHTVNPNRLLELPLLIGCGLVAVAPYAVVLRLRGFGGSEATASTAS